MSLEDDVLAMIRRGINTRHRLVMAICRYRISVMVGKAARLDHLYDPSIDDNARMGHYWWFWIPFHHWNGGTIKSGSLCVDHSIKWLCFWVTVTMWRVA